MTTPRPQAETRPKEVEISFWLWISTIVLGLLGSVPILFQFDQLRAQAITRRLSMIRRWIGRRSKASPRARSSLAP